MSFLDVQRQIENGVFDFIQEATGFGVDQLIWAQDRKSKPKKPYITILNLGLEADAHGREQGYEDDKAIVIEDYVNSFIITAYRDDPSLTYTARSILTQLSHSFGDVQLVKKHLSDNKIGYSDKSNIADVSIPLDGDDWEQRARFTVTFNVTVGSPSRIATGSIETVNVEDNVI